VKASNLAS